MKTACENGNCERLFDEKIECDFLSNKTKKQICDWISGEGLCMSKRANKPKKRRNANQTNDVFYRQSCRSYAVHEHEKNNRQYLPYRE